VEGIVSKCGLVHPKVVKSVHYCPATSQSQERTYRDVTSIDGLPTTGLYPKEDEEGHALVTEYGLSVYKNHQTLTIQEMPERAPTGQLPRSVSCIVDDDLVDSCKPGDRVQLTGIFRALPSKSNGGTKGIFKTVLLCNKVTILGKESLTPTLTSEDIKNITKIATDDNQSAFELLAKSLAPSIYGNTEIKRGLLSLLLGGEEKNLARGGHIRGDINVLMVGDPSCGKSQMLRFINTIAPHCLTTTGRGSSGVGLTAAVTTDQETGERRLEAGAMVLADRGIVCIDEFDKMSDADRVAIHEVMEQQTVTIAKAGIHTSLNARCSVLAAANPVYGQYDPYKPPQDNVALPDSLLSRFDLLYIMLDKMDPTIDRTLADHVLRSHTFRQAGEADGEPMHVEKSTDTVITEDPDADAGEEKETGVWATGSIYSGSTGGGRRRETRGQQKTLSVEFARKYILYAKAKCHPVLTSEAAEYIADRYTQLRLDTEKTRTLPVTARTLECMIRLSTAHAKSRLSDHVEAIDAKNAAALVHFSYYNEAEAKTRPGDEDDSDGSDGDGDDGDDDMGGSQQSRRSTPRTPKGKGSKGGKGSKYDFKSVGAKTPRSASKTPKKASAAAGGKKKASGKKDVFDFPGDGDEEEAEADDAGVATPKRSGRRGRSSTPRHSAAAAAAEEEQEQVEPVVEVEAAAAAPEEPAPVVVVKVTREQSAQLKEVLNGIFTSQRMESIEEDVLVEALEAKYPAKFSVAQVQNILETMAEDNEVMAVDGQIIRI